MLRPSLLPHARAVVTRLLLPLLGAVLLCLAGPLVGLPTPGAQAAAAPVDPQQPLVPHIRSITPDYVPTHGPIVVRGTITNASDQAWTAINVHGFMGSSALTTSAELAAAVRTPVNADVGPRITAAGTFASIPSLAPGETARFEIKLPHRDLPVSGAGVYWFGVHVLGDNGQGDARVAVGRDRTFLAYVPGAVSAGIHEDTALVVPVRAGVARGPDGSVVDPEDWTSSLQSGPLHAAVAIGQAAAGRPLTWLLDPAVPDVVRQLAHGNPGRTLIAGRKSSSQGPSPSPSTSSSGGGAVASSSTSVGASSRRIALGWLHALRPMVSAPTSQALGLPYGDLALETASTYDQPLLRAAYRHTRHALGTWGVSLAPAASPPEGRTTADTISRLPPDAEVLLPDSAVAGAASVVNRVDGHRVVLASAGAADGGPGPVAPESSLALRQRILAEAAVRLLDHQQPLVVELPVDGRRTLKPSFFSGLEVPWLQLTTVGDATAGAASQLDGARLRPPVPDDPALGPRLYFDAQQILDRVSKLQSVLDGNHALGRRLFAEVVGNASYAASQQQFVAAIRMRATGRWVDDQLHAISVSAPPSVTLASSSGRFSAVVSNGLDVPVTVRLQARSDRSMNITGDGIVQIPAHANVPVLLNASTAQRGVHNVSLELTTRDGRLLGSIDQFPMRAEQVSGLIWVIIGAGVGLLFAAIVVRLIRRVVRERPRRHSGTAPTEAPPEPALLRDLRHAEP